MNNSCEHIVVLVTAGSPDEAQKIADHVIEKKAAACVNVVKDIQSTFWWEGKIDHSPESLLVIKTRKDLFEQLQKCVMEVHSYDSPEIIALPIIAGKKEYLNWIDESVGE